MMILFFFFFIICIIHDSNSQSMLCGNEYKSAVEICTINTLTGHKLAYITTTGVPKFQQTLCECLITSNTSDVDISFSFFDGIVPQSLSFKANNNEIMSGEQHTFTTEDRSLTLSVLTNDNYTREGACLMVSSDTFFNVLCYRPLSHPTTAMTSSSLYPNSSSSVSTNKYKEKTTDEDNNHHILTLIVLPVLGGSVIVILTVIFVICMKRHRMVEEQRPSNQSNKVSMSDLVPNTEQRDCDTNTYEIPDQNVYEGLDRQGNASPGDTYQHLYTETNYSHVESQYLNLSHQQADTDTLENEYKNTSGKDSFGDGIHNKNSSYEYESYKTNATDRMYETLQTDD